MARDFTKIQAWKLADDLAVDVYVSTRNFPREELYGLTSQLRRAASSTPANIAEGSNRTSQKDYLHFLSVASGSLAEVRYFLHLSNRLGYLSEAEYKKLVVVAEATSKTLAGLMSTIQKQLAVRVLMIVFAISALVATLFSV
jgi:four helix bundle protein